MDAKLTPEQAIEFLNYMTTIVVHADCSRRDILNMQYTIALIESLAADAGTGVKLIAEERQRQIEKEGWKDGKS